VQDLRYGVPNGLRLAIYDAMDLKTRRYLDYPEFVAFADQIGMGRLRVPVLHQGPWGSVLRQHAEGKSLVPGADHVREGFVVRPIRERFDERIGRVVLKLHGEGYLLRKE
jgi:hypothetical protein